MELKQIFCDTPEQIPEKFVAFWNDRDPVGLSGLFIEDAEFVNVVGLWWHDRLSIYKAHDYGLRVIFNESTLKIGRLSKRMLSENIALVHVRMRLSGQSPYQEVTQPLDRQNIFSFVVQKFDRGWVAISAHNTDIVPGKETNLIDESGTMSAVDYRKLPKK